MPTRRDDALRAVARSLPNPGRPRLSTELEEYLEPVERRAALTYADGELATDRLNAIAAAMTSDGVPDAEILGDTSVVNHLEELRARALAPIDEE